MKKRKVRPGGGPLKRMYFLVAIAILQIIAGSLMILGAAQPVRTSPPIILVPTGTYYHYEFGILGTGRLSGNLSELQGRSLDVSVFDDRGYLAFRDGSDALPPLFEQIGKSIVFDLDLPGSGQYHIVVVGSPTRQEVHIQVEFTVLGLKTGDTILAVVVLVGGLALMAATLMLSVWAWRRTLTAPSPIPEPSPDPAPDPVLDPSPDPPAAPQDPPDDNTRVY